MLAVVPRMAHIRIDGDAVAIELPVMDKIWAVHGSLRIPLTHIVRATVQDESPWRLMWLKLCGTNAPGLKMAGTFLLNGGLAFLDFGSGRQCVVLETTHETYATVIVQADGAPQAIAAEINGKIPR